MIKYDRFKIIRLIIPRFFYPGTTDSYTVEKQFANEFFTLVSYVRVVLITKDTDKARWHPTEKDPDPPVNTSPKNLVKSSDSHVAYMTSCVCRAFICRMLS